MRLLLMLALLISLLIPSGVTLSTALALDGVRFTVTTDAARHFYAQVDGPGGGTVIYEFDLQPGQSFVRTAPIHGPGSATVRVWASDGGEGPAATSVIRFPGTKQILLPMALH